MRHTFTYYKEMLNGGNTKILEVMPEIIKKYGKDNRIRLDCKFEWNHCISGFGISNYGKDKGKIYVDVYWQGDSTDGNADAWLADVICRSEYVIPAEYDNIGGSYGVVQRHGNLRIYREEIQNAIQTLINYIQPKEVKKRKEDKRVRNVLSAIINEKRLDYRDRGISWFGSDKYYNAEKSICQFVDKFVDKLYKKTDEEVKEILETIWANNHKDNHLIKENYYGEKQYDFSF